MNEEDSAPPRETLYSSSSSSSYKQRHEEFVSDLTGGPIGEICAVTVVAAIGYLTWSALHTRTRSKFPDKNKKTTAGFASHMMDFVLNWLAIFLAVTIYSGDLATLHFLLLVPAITALIVKNKTAHGNINKAIASNIGIEQKQKPQAPKKDSRMHETGTSQNNHNSNNQAALLPRKPFLTVYRSSMMVLTCIAILAVDFPIFPRRFAKVETWGTSLMDMGVGAFVFSMGLVSAREPLRESLRDSKPPVIRSLAVSIKHAAPVLLLGFARLFFVKYFDYQEHVTEYGVHWNFFMTLGLLPPFVALFSALQPKIVPANLLALVFACLYEYALSHTNLRAFILVSPREDFISQNREGIFSFIGYFSIFLCGRSTGFYTLPAQVNWRNIWYMPTTLTSSVKEKEKQKDSRPKVLAMLIMSTVTHSVLLYIVLQYFTPSRRLANLPYVLFVVSFNTGMIAVLVTIDLMFFPPCDSVNFDYMDCVPYSLEAVNYNGLAVFLLANVATGLINMNVYTLDASVPQSLAILISYLLVLHLTSVYLYQRGIRIKI